MASENQNPNLVSGRQTPVVSQRRQTPISHRRPLQRINFNAAVLSPTKRRKQTHAEELSAIDAIKPAACREAGLLQVDRESQPFRRWSSDECDKGTLLLEVFRRLDVKDLIGKVAPACKLWREVAHSNEIWAILRMQTRLVDQLLVTEKVVERRSKGRLFKCKRLGSGEAVLLRMVDLELTNAGKDDGVPTSFLREAALLKKLQHPNIIRHFGSEILGKRAVMCTEFVHESFTHWYKRLEGKSDCDKLVEIKVNFRQLLSGLSHVHHQGVMHRNLKPDNIFIDPQGCVKLGDFTTTRMLDIPFQAYTPEDPKERDRSGREMRRLWYRAPELILRDEIYGPKVDAWSVGCLLAEAASGRALFQSDSEIDHLFRVFRLTGTPTAISWPEVVTMKNFSPKFPVYSGFSLAQVTRAATCRRTEDQEALMMQAQPDRDDILQNLLRVAAVLGTEGMFVLDHLIAVPPAARAGADAALSSPFFGTCTHRGASGSASRLSSSTIGEPSAPAQQWLFGSPKLGSSAAGAPAMASMPTIPAALAATPLDLQLESQRQPLAAAVSLLTGPSGSEGRTCPPVSIPSSLMPAHMVWNILHTMQTHERYSCAGCSSLPPPLPPGFDPAQRTVLMDLVIGLSSQLSLTDYTLHLAGRIIDVYLAQLDKPVSLDRLQIIGATCLKIADVFAEQSKEYYKQENAVEYADATLNLSPPFHATSEQMLICEKDVLPKLNFDLHLPTTHWFLQCYLAYARFTPTGGVAKTASFLGDLTLLDHDLLQYPPSLRAQCTMVLAVFLVQQAKQNRRPSSRPSSRPPATPAASAPMPPPEQAQPEQRQLPMPPPLPAFSAAVSGSRAGGAAVASDPRPPHITKSSSGGGSSASSGLGGADTIMSLTYLEHWDSHVRDHACHGNVDIDAEMCLQAVVKTLSVMRREWKSLKLVQVETKHGNLARTLVYPEGFPVSKLVSHILPSVVQGGMRVPIE